MIVMMGSQKYLLTLLSRGYPLLPEEKHHADHLRSPTLQNLFSRISAICKLEQDRDTVEGPPCWTFDTSSCRGINVY